MWGTYAKNLSPKPHALVHVTSYLVLGKMRTLMNVFALFAIALFPISLDVSL